MGPVAALGRKEAFVGREVFAAAAVTKAGNEGA